MGRGCHRWRQGHRGYRLRHAPPCLNLGELDEIRIDLVPALAHEGVHYLDNINNDAVSLEHLQTVDGYNVTHLRYRVNRS